MTIEKTMKAYRLAARPVAYMWCAQTPIEATETKVSPARSGL